MQLLTLRERRRGSGPVIAGTLHSSISAKMINPAAFWWCLPSLKLNSSRVQLKPDALPTELKYIAKIDAPSACLLHSFFFVVQDSKWTFWKCVPPIPLNVFDLWEVSGLPNRMPALYDDAVSLVCNLSKEQTPHARI